VKRLIAISGALVALAAGRAGAQPPPEPAGPDAAPPAAPAPAPAPARAPEPGVAGAVVAPPPDAAPKTPRLEVSGYLAPGFGLKGRPDALPRDRLEYGFVGGAGLIFKAAPFPMWSANLHIVLSSQLLNLVTGASEADFNGDNIPDAIVVSEQRFELPGKLLEEATVTFQPAQVFALRGGVLRIPFTVQQQSPNTALLFPNRSQPNEVFVSGSDLGVLAEGNFGDGRLRGSVGIFNGSSLGLQLRKTVPRGIVYSFRADVNPFGDFPFWEGDAKRGRFRLGLGGGLLYRPETLFNDAGYTAGSADDVRVSASLRMAVAGLYVGIEYLHRTQTDTISSRPKVADGAYTQISYFIPVRPSFALAPIARLGITVENENVEPRQTGWLDAGFSFFPRADAPEPDALKLTLQYLLERRFTEGEDAHGFVAQVQLKF